MARTDWRKIADGLAARLLNHLYCVDSEREGHQPEDCPFCRDIAAYDAYVAAGGTVRKVVITGEAIDVADLIRRSPNGG